jgi:RasGEF domain/RasGEF N-terminal motif
MSWGQGRRHSLPTARLAVDHATLIKRAAAQLTASATSISIAASDDTVTLSDTTERSDVYTISSVTGLLSDVSSVETVVASDRIRPPQLQPQLQPQPQPQPQPYSDPDPDPDPESHHRRALSNHTDSKTQYPSSTTLDKADSKQRRSRRQSQGDDSKSQGAWRAAIKSNRKGLARRRRMYHAMLLNKSKHVKQYLEADIVVYGLQLLTHLRTNRLLDGEKRAVLVGVLFNKADPHYSPLIQLLRSARKKRRHSLERQARLSPWLNNQEAPTGTAVGDTVASEQWDPSHRSTIRVAAELGAVARRASDTKRRHSIAQRMVSHVHRRGHSQVVHQFDSLAERDVHSSSRTALPMMELAAQNIVADTETSGVSDTDDQKHETHYQQQRRRNIGILTSPRSAPSSRPTSPTLNRWITMPNSPPLTPQASDHARVNSRYSAASESVLSIGDRSHKSQRLAAESHHRNADPNARIHTRQASDDSAVSMEALPLSPVDWPKIAVDSVKPRHRRLSEQHFKPDKAVPLATVPAPKTRQLRPTSRRTVSDGAVVTGARSSALSTSGVTYDQFLTMLETSRQLQHSGSITEKGNETLLQGILTGQLKLVRSPLEDDFYDDQDHSGIMQSMYIPLSAYGLESPDSSPRGSDITEHSILSGSDIDFGSEFDYHEEMSVEMTAYLQNIAPDTLLQLKQDNSASTPLVRSSPWKRPSGPSAHHHTDSLDDFKLPSADTYLAHSATVRRLPLSKPLGVPTPSIPTMNATDAAQSRHATVSPQLSPTSRPQPMPHVDAGIHRSSNSLTDRRSNSPLSGGGSVPSSPIQQSSVDDIDEDDMRDLEYLETLARRRKRLLSQLQEVVSRRLKKSTAHSATDANDHTDKSQAGVVLKQSPDATADIGKHASPLDDTVAISARSSQSPSEEPDVSTTTRNKNRSSTLFRKAHHLTISISEIAPPVAQNQQSDAKDPNEHGTLRAHQIHTSAALVVPSPESLGLPPASPFTPTTDFSDSEREMSVTSPSHSHLSDHNSPRIGGSRRRGFFRSSRRKTSPPSSPPRVSHEHGRVVSVGLPRVASLYDSGDGRLDSDTSDSANWQVSVPRSLLGSSEIPSPPHDKRLSFEFGKSSRTRQRNSNTTTTQDASPAIVGSVPAVTRTLSTLHMRPVKQATEKKAHTSPKPADASRQQWILNQHRRRRSNMIAIDDELRYRALAATERAEADIVDGPQNAATCSSSNLLTRYNPASPQSKLRKHTSSAELSFHEEVEDVVSRYTQASPGASPRSCGRSSPLQIGSPQREESGSESEPVSPAQPSQLPSNIISGSANKLVEALVDIYHSDLTFRSIFLLTYREFTTPRKLLAKLIRLFQYYDVHAVMFDRLLERFSKVDTGTSESSPRGKSRTSGSRLSPSAMPMIDETCGDSSNADSTSAPATPVTPATPLELSSIDHERIKRLRQISLQFRLKIFAVLQNWVKHYYIEDFFKQRVKDGTMMDALNNFLQQLRHQHPDELIRNIVTRLQAMCDKLRVEYDDEEEKKLSRHLLVQSSSRLLAEGDLSKVQLGSLAGNREFGRVLRSKSKDIAQQLTIIEFEKFNRIRPLDLGLFRWTKRDAETECPHVVAFVRNFNEVSFWTAALILHQPTAKKRIHTLRKMVKIAYECWTIGNFNAVFEIVAGLSMHAVYRLKELAKGDCLRGKEKQKYFALMELFSPNNNYVVYRRELMARLSFVDPSLAERAAGGLNIDTDGAITLDDSSMQVATVLKGASSIAPSRNIDNVHPVVLPHMGVVMKDLATVIESPCKLKDGAVDFARLRTLSGAISYFIRCQRPIETLPFKVKSRMNRMLSREIDQSPDEKGLMDRSCELQPMRLRRRQVN